MNDDSEHIVTIEDAADTRPILIVPYMWIGDFVRGHSVVRVLNQRWPNRPVDLLTTTLCAPLVDYMPGVRSGIVWDLPRSRLAVAKQWGLAAQLRARDYGTAIVLPRTWKSAIAPALAGIPERIGFVGEARFGLINQWRWGEKALPRFIDKNAALALPDGAPLPPEWPVPQLRVPAEEVSRFRQAWGLGQGTAVALAPGSVGASKRWTYYPQAARLLAERGLDVWVVGGPGEKALGLGNRGRRRTARPRPHRNRPAQRDSGSCGGPSRDFKRFRPDAYRRRPGNADHGHFRPHQPLSLGAAQRPGGNGSDQNGRPVPAMPPPGLHHERASLHAGYSRIRCGRYRPACAGRGRGPILPIRHSGMVRKHQTSDAQLRIGESRAIPGSLLRIAPE